MRIERLGTNSSPIQTQDRVRTLRYKVWGVRVVTCPPGGRVSLYPGVGAVNAAGVLANHDQVYPLQYGPLRAPSKHRPWPAVTVELSQSFPDQTQNANPFSFVSPTVLLVADQEDEWDVIADAHGPAGYGFFDFISGSVTGCPQSLGVALDPNGFPVPLRAAWPDQLPPAFEGNQIGLLGVVPRAKTLVIFDSVVPAGGAIDTGFIECGHYAAGKVTWYSTDNATVRSYNIDEWDAAGIQTKNFQSNSAALPANNANTLMFQWATQLPEGASNPGGPMSRLRIRVGAGGAGTARVLCRARFV